MNWNERLRRWLVPQLPQNAKLPVLESGIQHYQRERDGLFVRYHLRVEADGSAVLIAAASEAVRLSPLGAAAAKGLLDGDPVDEIVTRFEVPDAKQAVDEVREVIDQLGRPDIRFPIFNLADAEVGGRANPLMAPFQADLVPGTVSDMREILSRLWNAGVFHARLLPQDDSDWDQLHQIVEWAEDLGMITGLRASASRLMEKDFVQRLAAAGLDYVVLPWGVLPEVHTAICGEGDFQRLDEAVPIVRGSEMTCVLESPLVAETIDALDDQIWQLSRWNVSDLETFAVARQGAGSPDDDGLHALDPGELRQAAVWIEDLAEEHGLRIAWLPPVAAASSAALTAGQGPRAAGDAAIRVSASGDVFAARGPLRRAGNLLQDSWSTIWGSQQFSGLREGRAAEQRCVECPGLAICHAGCPADPSRWATNESTEIEK